MSLLISLSAKIQVEHLLGLQNERSGDKGQLTEHDDLLLGALGHGVAKVPPGGGEAGDGDARVLGAHLQLQVGGDVPPQGRRRRRVPVRVHALFHLRMQQRFEGGHGTV